MPYQYARAHMHDAPHQLVSFTIEMHSWNLIIVSIFAFLGQNFPNSEDSHIARALHVHSAP